MNTQKRSGPFYMGTNEHCVYILECSDGSYYTGYTNNLEKRLKAHQEGKAAKYTRGRVPVQLRYHQIYATKSEAMKAEYQIKQLPRSAKERLMSEGMNGNEAATEL